MSCGPVASAGPQSERPCCKDLGPCQVAMVPCLVISLCIFLQNFFSPSATDPLRTNMTAPVCLLIHSVVMHPYTCSLLYPSNLLRGPEKNTGCAEVCCKIPLYFHGYRDFTFVFFWISVRTIQKRISTFMQKAASVPQPSSGFHPGISNRRV